ncbi:50S ribosomal protein L11 [Candidatus Woesearchaeota archaeon CG10_big_fil_rev_8_21_14_0_10_44_13]|nr:MAG: 50S ribosomal protein L11 [Candidatus Woesearchaeota archaeon CG10_big_fil_rev_8_21_14_0_10_44_13]
MAKQTVEALVEGGKATAAPPLGPALGPMGVNIGQVVAEINKKTAEFKGMQVPVKVIIDSETKKFEVTVGTPPASALIKKEAGVEKGSGNPLMDKIADLKIEQIIKISKMKQDSLLGKDNFSRVKEIIGTCDSMGVLVEGKQARETIADINKGMFKDKIQAGKTELTAEELKALEEERKKLEEEMKARRAEFEAKAKEIINSMTGKEPSAIRSKLREAKIPEKMIKELMPTEAAGAGAAAGGEKKPEAGKAAEAPKKEAAKKE